MRITPQLCSTLALLVALGLGSTSTAHAQYNCAAQNEVAVQDCEALVAFMEATNVEAVTDGAGQWGSGAIPDWQGVFVQDDRVTVINLHGLQLTGYIPVALAQLSALQTLSLGENELEYFEEGSYEGWTSLQILGLVDNEFRALPDLSGLPALQTLWVFSNSLTFEDLEPLASLVGTINFRYWPMRLVVPQVDDATGTVSVDIGGAKTTYAWYQGPFNFFNPPIAGATEASYTVAESGLYYATADNEGFPELTMRSEEVDVEVARCADEWLPREDLNTPLPPSIRVFENCNRSAWLVRATPAPGEWSFKVASSSSVSASGERTFSRKTVSSFAKTWGAFVAVNGGFFNTDAGQSLSLIASGGALLAANAGVLTRDNVAFYPTRATFGINELDLSDMAWTYHVRNDDGTRTLYKYPEPSRNAPGNSQPPPTSTTPANGSVWRLQEGIGGGPMLVQDGAVDITWEEEVFFGSGGSGGPVGYVNTQDPRTAMGLTDTGELLFVVADGRCPDGSDTDPCANGSARLPGLSHQEMAALMVSLGAHKAMNLDGGGSSVLVVDDTVVNNPSDGGERSVASALVLTPRSPASAAVFDSGDACCYAEEGSWIADTEGASSGSTPARLNEIGTGADRAVWRFPDLSPGRYEVAAWWTPASNRATNTPYTIYQQGIGKTTTLVRVDQTDTTTAHRWNVLGTFDLAPGDSVVVTDDATGHESPAYVVVDAIRLTAITGTGTEDGLDVPEVFSLAPNYPNPFNPETTIPFTLPQQAHARLAVYDVLGREVAVLVDETLAAGRHQARFEAGRLATGLYFCRLTADRFSQTRPMVLLR